MANTQLHAHIDWLDAWAAADGRRDRYPKICSAIRDLIEARREDVAPYVLRKQLAIRRKPATGGASQQRPAAVQRLPMSARVWKSRAKKKIEQLTAELRAHKSSKA